MPEKESGSFTALGVPNYRTLFLGTLGSFTGFFMSTAVQGVVAFDLTGTNSAVGSAVFGQGLGMFLMGPIGGAYADRLPKRRVVATGQILSAMVFGTLGLLYALEVLVLPHLVLGSFLVGTAFGMIGPARQAIAVDLVPGALLGNAMALNNVANTISRVFGPFLAAIVLAYDWAGPAAAYAGIAGLYMTSALLLLLLPRSIVRANVGDTHVLEDLSAGLRYVWTHARLRGYLLFFASIMLIGFPHVTLLPGLLENVLGRPAREVTDFYLASAVGALFASVTVARYADSPRAGLLYSLTAVAFGASLAFLAGASSYPSALFWMIVVGAASGAFHALNGAVLARETEPVYMGRVMSLSLLAFAGFGLTALPLGILADLIGESNVLLGMGLGVLVLACWMTIAELRSAQRG
jgi:MFS family permease